MGSYVIYGLPVTQYQLWPRDNGWNGPLSGKTRILDEAIDQKIRADPWVELGPSGGVEMPEPILSHPLTVTGS